jgi:hypothetical protein
VTRDQKITLGEMRASGGSGLLAYCSDYQCGHLAKISGDRWPDHIRLSELEALSFVRACGARGADVRPDFDWDAQSEGPARLRAST